MRQQVSVIWDPEEDADGNYVHIVVEHGVSQDEVDDAVCDPSNPTVESDSSGRPMTFGWTQTGRYLVVVWDPIADDPLTIKPVTAYEVPPPGGFAGPTGGRRRKRRRR